jgi:hypothetical protein
VKREFWRFGTGESLVFDDDESFVYLGTILLLEGDFVHHLFERTRRGMNDPTVK